MELLAFAMISESRVQAVGENLARYADSIGQVRR
jgi:hypothetical protein